MIHALLNRLTAPPDAPMTPSLRRRYGNVASMTGLLTNILLAIIKGSIGWLTGSVAIIGDALNNLTDSASSLVMIVSFKLSAKPPDRRHPFGHARTEYLLATLISALVLMVGAQLMVESVRKILSPQIISLPNPALALLIFSIFCKLFLWRFYRLAAKRAYSPIIDAAAVDSIADVLTTVIILGSIVLSPIFHIDLDGYMGVVAGLVILKNGYDILKDTVNKLLGERPNSALVQRVHDFVCAYDGVYGVHDLIVHDYGPGHSFASLHVEVDATVPPMDSHSLIDRIESDAAEALGIHLTIHMDPLNVHDPRTEDLHRLATSIVATIDERIDLHDFRIIDSHYHTYLIFDLALPETLHATEADIKEEINHRLALEDSRFSARITFDPYFMINDGIAADKDDGKPL